MNDYAYPDVSRATRLARHHRLLEALGPLAGPSLTIDPSNFVDPDLTDPANDRTLLRAQWANGLAITAAWTESGGLIGPLFKVQAAVGDPNGTYLPIHEERLQRGAVTHAYTIPAPDLPWEGNVYLRVSVSINNGADQPSEPFLVRLDRIAPYERSGIEHPPAPIPPASLITDADLAGDFTLKIPSYLDQEAGDIVYVWLEKEPPSSGTPLPPLIASVPTVAGETTVQVPAASIQAKGDGRFHLAYVLADKAGNYSAVSQAAPVTLVLGTLPGTLLAPAVPAADPVIDRADAAAGVYVDVPEMPGWKAGDQVSVTFGGQALPAYTLNPGAFQALIDVPASVLLGVFGNASSEMSVDVSYTLSRLDWISSDSPVTTVSLDLSKAGPDNPDWPDPINDSLTPVVVTSDSGNENEIPEADLGQAATLTFTVYPGANENDTVEFFWGNAAFETYTLQAGDSEGSEIRRSIPWARIETTLDQANVPVFYRIRRPSVPAENYQQSPDTSVDVSSLPLQAAPVAFPNADDSLVPGYQVLTCDQLVENDAGEPCIEVQIPDLSGAPYNQQVGDVVSLRWKGFSGMTFDGGSLTPIAPEDGGEYDVEHALEARDLQGFSWLVPYEPYGAATYKYKGDPSSEGMIQVSYSIQVGSKVATAQAPDNVIAAFYTSNGPCDDTTLVGGCADCHLG